MDRKQNFLYTTAQTNPSPYLIDVAKASGLYITDRSGKKYMDMIAGVSVNNFGHCHPKIVEAICGQVKQYMHVMVYGEYIQEPHLQLCQKLVSMLYNKHYSTALDCVYTVNSGTEANELALKLAKRATNRTELIAFSGSYHGNTHGSMSVSYNEKKKSPFRPLLPDVRFIEFNHIEALDQITERTAGVIIETIQGDAGVRIPDQAFMTKLRERCTEVGALLIFDEIQCGMGRVGHHFAHQHFQVAPDILTLGKALGGGLPIGVLVSAQKYLTQLTHNPILGHITTFGGNPVVAASALASLDILETEIDCKEVNRLGRMLSEMLATSDKIKEIRQLGMMFAFDMESEKLVQRVVQGCLEKGLISFWFLSHPYSFRLSPPLTIAEDETLRAGEIILDVLKSI